MKKTLALKVMTLAVGMLTFLATTTTASACWFGIYQPEEPKLLREE
jgi:cyclic lactone autoinducer peptide